MNLTNWVITILVEQERQVLSLVGANVEEQSRTLVGPEAQEDIFSSQCPIREDGRRMEAVAEGRPRLKDGWNLFRKEYHENEVSNYVAAWSDIHCHLACQRRCNDVPDSHSATVPECFSIKRCLNVMHESPLTLLKPTLVSWEVWLTY